MENIISALIGGFFSILVMALGVYIVKKKNKRIIIQTLVYEMECNERIIKKSLSYNEKSIKSLDEDDINNNNTIIDQETSHYFSRCIDIYLENWAREDVKNLVKEFPFDELLDYKVAVERVNFLIERFGTNRYRAHHIKALNTAHKELSLEIKKLKPKIDILKS